MANGPEPVFLAIAEAELDEAISYYDAVQNGLGKDFAREVQRGGALIAQYPEAWQPLDARVRRYRLNRFPYGLVYAVSGAAIVILAVMHLHRQPGYWRDRLPGT